MQENARLQCHDKECPRTIKAGTEKAFEGLASGFSSSKAVGSSGTALLDSSV